MYKEFFGLRKFPFQLTPDPDFLYVTAQHREALAGLTYAIMARKGFVVLIGNAGTGKTTLLTRIMHHLPATRVQSSVIVNPTLTPSEFLEAALLDFGFQNIPSSKAQRIVALQSFLWKGHREGRTSALVVDEAHKLTPEVLEEVRLLGNFEASDEKLLQIVLVGQTELGDLLNGEGLRQLKQRIALRLVLEPLPEPEVELYIAHRWMKAGGTASPFTADAIAAIAQGSKGIPRVINGICDSALIEAFADGSASVEFGHVLTVCRELCLAEPVLPRAAQAPLSPAPVVAAPVDGLSAARAPAAAAPVPPAVEPAVVDEASLKTLERYAPVKAKRSLLSRVAGKLGIIKGPQQREQAI